MPEDLPIDHDKSLNGTMAAYAEQVLICTGKDDWTSRIEDENSGDNLAADVKELVGRGGRFSDVCSVHSSLSARLNDLEDPHDNTSYSLYGNFFFVPFLVA